MHHSAIARSNRIISHKHHTMSKSKHRWLLWNQYCQLKDTRQFFPLLSFIIAWSFVFCCTVKRIFKMLIYVKNTTKPPFFPLLYWNKGRIFILVLTCWLSCVLFNFETCMKENVSSLKKHYYILDDIMRMSLAKFSFKCHQHTTSLSYKTVIYVHFRFNL